LYISNLERERVKDYPNGSIVFPSFRSFILEVDRRREKERVREKKETFEINYLFKKHKENFETF